MPAQIIEVIRSAENLPSLPAVALEVLRLTRSEDVSLAELAQVIQRDPAMTGRILKTANSSLFGMPRRIAALPQAMVVLGLRSVKVLTLSFSLVDVFTQEQCAGFDFPAYWRRSLTTAVAGRLLAEKSNRTAAEEVFVSGLLCDIGMLAALRWANELYRPVLQSQDSQKEPPQVVELRLLGATHEAISADLLNRWELPDFLCTAVASHHAPIANDPTDPLEREHLLRTVRAAAAIADLFCSPAPVERLNALKREIVQGVGVDAGALEEILENLDQQVREAAPLFSLKIAPTRTYSDIQEEAQARLVRLTISTELEHARLVRQTTVMQEQVEELEDQNRELTEQATTDGLTGIANRAALEEKLGQLCRDSAARETPVGLLFMDLDRFKKLNDTYGHRAGDQALQALGACLRGLVKGDHFVARYGGEEFVALVPGVSRQGLARMADQIRVAIQDIRIPQGPQWVGITASIGAVHMDGGDPALSPKELLERADQCLYLAKHDGRNRVVTSQDARLAAVPSADKR